MYNLCFFYACLQRIFVIFVLELSLVNYHFKLFNLYSYA